MGTKKIDEKKVLHLLAAILVLISFFLPWVTWDGNSIMGMDMTTGHFFKISESKFNVANPFPQLNFLFYAFWLIPVLSLITISFALSKKRTAPFSFMAGALALALVTVYLLFSKTLIDLGAGKSLVAMLKPGVYVQAVSAIVLILTVPFVKRAGWKLGWLIIGPVIAFSSFKLGEKYVLGETQKKTENVKPDYIVSATALINEFLANDTAANKKYIEKMLLVNGNLSAVETLPDSSSTLKFADSTGSYAIFSFEKEQLNQVKNIQPGSAVSVKAVCSGSIYSEILGTTSISFKRSTLNK